MCSNLQRNRALRRFLVVFIYLHVCFIAQARGNQGGEEKVTIVVKNAPLRDVFKSITKQTGLYLFYSPEVVNVQDKVTVSAKDQPVEAVLNKVLEDKGLAWIYNGNAITIRTKDKEEKKRVLPSEEDSTANPVQLNITGKVTDVNGNAIPGATVLVGRTKEGATADSEGNFSIPNVRKNDRLQVSSIGFETREVQVQGNSMLVKLSLAVNDLDETVVIAYGTTTKRYNIGDISTIKADEITKQPISNPLQALQGRVPGMFITQRTGMPGSAFKVQIRGQNSIENGNNPFYVIDGVPYVSELVYNLNPAGGGNPLNFINPSDIESIDVLKDADATAIYGSRGANGVVLITTKKGKVGTMKLDVNVYSGIGKATRKVNWLNTQEYLEMRTEAFKTDNAIPDANSAPDLLVWDTARYTDWNKVLIGDVAHYADAQASISGGNVNTQYVVGSGYHRESTVFPFNGAAQKASVHFNINSTSSNNKASLVVSGNYTADNSNLPSADLTNLLNTPPDAPPIYDKDGNLNWANSTWTGNGNPFAFTRQKYKSNTNNLVSNAVLSYHLLEGLDIKSSFGYTSMQVNEVSTFPIASQNPAFSPTAGAGFTNNTIRSWIIEPQATYNLSLTRNRIGILLGATFQKNVTDGQYLYASGFTSDALLENIQAAPNLQINSITNTVYKYNALFGRINYSYLDRYLLNLTLRRDGSSRFGPNRQFHNFGSLGAAWIFSNESIIKTVLPFLTFGKLRGSYGTTGNDQIGDYRFYDLFSTTFYSYQGLTGLTSSGLYNPDLAWEETKKLETGLELGFLNDRILVNASYYRNRSSNQLLSYALPLITGFSAIAANLPAVVQNYGWEFTINTANIRSKGITWSSALNLTVPRNKLISFTNIENSSYNYSYVVGQPISIFRAYHFIGVDPQTGVYQFADSKDNPTFTPSPLTDRTSLINTAPKFYGGFQNSLSYKGFQIDVLFQFVKQLGVNYLLQSFAPPGVIGNNVPSDVLGNWKKPGDKKRIQKFTQNYSSDAFAAYQYAKGSDFNYVDASFIRLKTLAISYSLPGEWTQRVHIHNCKVYAQGQNLFTITKYKGTDPESQNLTALPPLVVMTVGIQLSL